MNVLNVYVLYVIDYIRFGLFGDSEKEEWSKKVLLVNLVKFILCL